MPLADGATCVHACITDVRDNVKKIKDSESTEEDLEEEPETATGYRVVRLRVGTGQNP